MSTKKALLMQTLDFLEGENFIVSTVDSQVACFDLLARKKTFSMILKFLLNIDSLNEELASDFKALSAMLSAHPLLIGERTRNFELQDGVIHSRHGINAITMQTFLDVFSNGIYPVISTSRGGDYVRIDGEKLKKIRSERNISVGELSERIGVSRTMIYSYENRGLSATFSTMLRIEEYLDASLAVPLDVFASPPPVEREIMVEGDKKEAFEKLERIGFSIYAMRRAPFDAVTIGEQEHMLSKMGGHGERTVKDIRSIKEFSELASCLAFVIANSSKYEKNFEGVPVINCSELKNIESQDEFIEILEQRR